MAPTTADTILSRFVVRAKFRHMHVLIKLAELGSMRRAAEAVNMTQPAISQQVSELEKLIGAELFFRHAKGVRPTEIAKDLLPVAYRVVAALQDGSEAVANRLQSRSGTVRVTASPAAVGGLLLGALGPFSAAHPSIQVQINETSGSGELDGLLNDQADIICTRAPQTIPEGWQFVPCLDDSLIVVCGINHPLAKQQDIPPTALGQYRWLMNRIGSVARSRFERALQDHNWPETARGSLILHVPELTRELLVTKDNLAILPHSVAWPWLQDGSVCILDTALTERLPPLGFLKRTPTTGDAVERLAKFLMERAATRPQMTDG